MYRRLSLLGAFGFIAAYLLYDNLWLSIAGSLVFALYGIINKHEYIKAAKRRIRACFLDFLICLEPLLKTCGTFSGAFTEAVADYGRFHGKDDISRILGSAANEFMINKPTGEILWRLASKLDIDDARLFAGSMAICESTGGDAVEIIERTTELLVGNTRLICDINTSLSGKLFEQKVITAMPFILLGMFRAVSSSYLEPLYTTAYGRIIMTAAGTLFLAQWSLGKKIADIRF
jgi:tight adherence protein B